MPTVPTRRTTQRTRGMQSTPVVYMPKMRMLTTMSLMATSLMRDLIELRRLRERLRLSGRRSLPVKSKSILLPRSHLTQLVQREAGVEALIEVEAALREVEEEPLVEVVANMVLPSCTSSRSKRKTSARMRPKSSSKSQRSRSNKPLATLGAKKLQKTKLILSRLTTRARRSTSRKV